MGKANVFDLLGPVMVGPSSSHTAGAVRLGAMARKIFNGEFNQVHIVLHGSFAETGKGHGTNLALVAGLLNMKPDDERISRSLELADERGLKLDFAQADLGDVHPNTVKFILKSTDGRQMEITGSSIGGGRIVIKEIDQFSVEIPGDYHTLVLLHRDLPGVVAQVTNLLAAAQVNIAQMRVSREKKGAQALTVVEADQKIDQDALALIRKLPSVVQAMAIEPLE